MLVAWTTGRYQRLALTVLVAAGLWVAGGSAAAAPLTTMPVCHHAKDFGVNWAGGEFGASILPGVNGVNSIYPSDGWRATYFASRGLRLVRLPFLWERVQWTAFGSLSSSDVASIRSVLDTAETAGQTVILDMHNYGRYHGVPLTTADAPKLVHVWQQLAVAFRGHPALYGYELMNEPHDLPEGAAGWAALAQAATTAIRQVDSQAYILVPGYGWQSAMQWPTNNPTLDVADPAGRVLYAAHQYFDADGSGRYYSSYEASGAYPAVGADRVQPFLNWLADRNAQGILTEYGVPSSDPRWLDVLDTFLSAINRSLHVQGGTYWAAGPWWGTYPLSVEPTESVDPPQMHVLSAYPSR